MYDLDNLESLPAPVKSDLEQMEKNGLERPEAIIDEYTKRVYLADVSGSMSKPLLGTESVLAYEWLPETFERIRQRILNAQLRQAANIALLAGITVTEHPAPFPNENLKNDKYWLSLVRLQAPEAIKADVVSKGLAEELGLKRNLQCRSVDFSQSKIVALKSFLKEILEDRFNKYAYVNLEVMPFAEATGRGGDLTPEEILEVVDRLNAVGFATNILGAIEAGADACIFRPSEIGLNQIILITDALDGRAHSAMNLLPKLKAGKITLDFLHVVSPHEVVLEESSYVELRKLCEATGGQYIRVDRAAAFRETFITMSKKILLLS